MAKSPHIKKLLMFENAFNMRGLGANNYYLQATFNKAPIKTFLCRVNPHLVQRIRHVLFTVPCDFLQKTLNDICPPPYEFKEFLTPFKVYWETEN